LAGQHENEGENLEARMGTGFSTVEMMTLIRIAG